MKTEVEILRKRLQDLKTHVTITYQEERFETVFVSKEEELKGLLSEIIFDLNDILGDYMAYGVNISLERMEKLIEKIEKEIK